MLSQYRRLLTCWRWRFNRQVSGQLLPFLQKGLMCQEKNSSLTIKKSRNWRSMALHIWRLHRPAPHRRHRRSFYKLILQNIDRTLYILVLWTASPPHQNLVFARFHHTFLEGFDEMWGEMKENRPHGLFPYRTSSNMSTRHGWVNRFQNNRFMMCHLFLVFCGRNISLKRGTSVIIIDFHVSCSLISRLFAFFHVYSLVLCQTRAKCYWWPIFIYRLSVRVHSLFESLILVDNLVDCYLFSSDICNL